MVRVEGFEPSAPCSQNRCATRLRQTRERMPVYSRLPARHQCSGSIHVCGQTTKHTWQTKILGAGHHSGLANSGRALREGLGSGFEAFNPTLPTVTYVQMCVSLLLHAAPGTIWAGIRGAGPKRSRNFPALLGSWGPVATPAFRSPGLCRFSPISRRIRALSLRDLPAIF